MGCSGCADRGTKNVPVNKPNKRNRVFYKQKFHHAGTEPIDKLQAFTIANLKDFVVFYNLLETINASIDDVEEWINGYEKRRKIEMDDGDYLFKNAVKFMNALIGCPRCNTKLEAIQVNSMPCNKIGGKYRWLIYCPDIQCGWEHAIQESLISWVHEKKRENVRRLKQRIKEDSGAEGE